MGDGGRGPFPGVLPVDVELEIVEFFSPALGPRPRQHFMRSSNIKKPKNAPTKAPPMTSLEGRWSVGLTGPVSSTAAAATIGDVCALRSTKLGKGSRMDAGRRLDPRSRPWEV